MDLEKPRILIACLNARISELEISRAGVNPRNPRLVMVRHPTDLDGRRRELLVDLLDLGPQAKADPLTVRMMRDMIGIREMHVIPIEKLKSALNAAWLIGPLPTLKPNS